MTAVNKKSIDQNKPAIPQINVREMMLVESGAELKSQTVAQLWALGKKAMYEMACAHVCMAVRARDLGFILLELDERFPALSNAQRYAKFREETGVNLGDTSFDAWKGLARRWDYAESLLGSKIYDMTYTAIKGYLRHGRIEKPKRKLPLAYVAAQQHIQDNPELASNPESIANPYKDGTPEAQQWEEGKTETIAALKAPPKQEKQQSANPDALLSKAEADLTAAFNAIPAKLKKKDKDNSLALLEKIKHLLDQIEAKLS